MKIFVWMLCLMLGPVHAIAATQDLTIPGRLFFTPTQRAMLNDARQRNVMNSPLPAPAATTTRTPAPVSFDGVITRSDGVATHWVNGRPQVGRTSDKVRDLKPGQTRTEQQIFESYQIRQSNTTPPTQISPSPKNNAAVEDSAP